MGILVELFIAEAAEALEYNPSQIIDEASHRERFKPAEYQGMTDLEFSRLWAILANEPWDEDLHMLEGVAHGEDYGWWLFRFPERFVAELRKLNDAGISRAAAAWSEVEEVGGITGVELEAVIRDLHGFAQKIEGTQKELYLWGSL